jgi:hypothetical protein
MNSGVGWDSSVLFVHLNLAPSWCIKNTPRILYLRVKHVVGVGLVFAVIASILAIVAIDPVSVSQYRSNTGRDVGSKGTEYLARWKEHRRNSNKGWPLRRYAEHDRFLC